MLYFYVRGWLTMLCLILEYMGYHALATLYLYAQAVLVVDDLDYRYGHLSVC